MNVWNFTGNLGQDAEQRYTQDGTAITSFSVAVKSGFGERTATTWARCSLFGRRGESLARYLTKGQQVAVSGELTAREWNDKQGVTRTSIEVRVNDVTLIGRRDNQAPQEQSQSRQNDNWGSRPDSGQGLSQGQGQPDYDDDDIPF